MEGNILIVDDDPDTREILSRILGAVGLTTKTASNGVEALSHIKDEIPDLILLDLMMPQMDGFQVLYHLRSDPTTRYVPVIVVTGCGISKDMLKLPGVAKVIQKSRFSVTKMQATVTDLLNNNLERSNPRTNPSRGVYKRSSQ